MKDMTFQEIEGRKKVAENFAAALVAGAFVVADKFAREMSEFAERFYLLAAHELLASFIIRCGGQHCRHLGNNFPETSYINMWVKGVIERIRDFPDADEDEVEFIKMLVLEKLIQQGSARVRAEYIGIPAMDASAILEPGKKEAQVVA